MRSASPPIPTGRRRPHSVRRRLAQTSGLAVLLAVTPAKGQVAPPVLPVPLVPDADIAPGASPNVLNISIDATAPLRTIRWQSFNIGTATDSTPTVNFLNKQGTSGRTAVLNRVETAIGVGRSEIYGKLNAPDNMSIYLVNQAGILFGNGSAVSVGSLVASTRDLAVDRTGKVLSIGDGVETLPSVLLNGDRSIVVDGGSTIAAKAGIVALIAARIENYGAITATQRIGSTDGGDVAIVAADDVTLTLSDDSPIGVQINKGTSLGTPVVLQGTVTGRSILVAAATQQTVTDALLDVQATLIARTATASDRGIVLAAGIAPAASGLVMPAASAADEPAVLRLGGTLATDGPGGTIAIGARDGIVAPASGTAANLTATGTVRIRADAGGVALGDVTTAALPAAGDAVDIAAPGAVSLAAVTANGGISLRGGSVAVAGSTTSDRGRVAVAAGSLALGAVKAGANDEVASIVAAGDATLASVDAGRIVINAVGALTATRLTARDAATGGLALSATAAGATIDTVEAGNGSLKVAAGASGATVTTLAAKVDALLSSTGTTRLLGSASTGRDLTLSGADVTLGGVAGAEQRAGRDAFYTATAGAITGIATTPALTIRADTDAADATKGALRLTAASRIDLSGVALVTGTGTTNSGDVVANLSMPGAPLVLGRVAANMLSVANTAGPLDSDVTLGQVDVAKNLILSTTGSITATSITGGESLALTSGSSVVVTGRLSGTTGVGVTGATVVRLDGGVAAGSGTAALTAGGTDLRTGAVTGGIVTLTSGGTVTATDAIGATGAVTFDAPGAIVVSDVRSTGDTVLFRSTPPNVTGAITAGAVRAALDLDVARAPGLTFASATSDGRGVSLSSIGGTVTVNGAITAGKGVTVEAQVAKLQSVTARDGAISLIATRGDLATGTLASPNGSVTLGASRGALTVTDAVTARDAIGIAANGAITLRDVASDGAGVKIASAEGTVGAGAIDAAFDADISGDEGVTVASAIARGRGGSGSARLVSNNGGVAAGAITTAGAARVEAAGAARLSDAVDARGDLLVQGRSVTLGNTAKPVAQSAGGRVDVVSTAGAITGVTGLTLRSGAGSDLVLRSAIGIGLADGTLIGGGAVRLGAGRGEAITVGTVEARTIASPGTGGRLNHDGPVTIGRATAREDLDVVLGGDGRPALRIDAAEVLGGNLSLDAGGALVTDTLTVRAGTATLAGGTVTANAVRTRDLTVTTRGGAATVSTAEATAGNIAITTVGGGLAAPVGSARTTLSAATGAIALDVDGAAVLDSASARAITIAATSLDVREAVAKAGALTLTTRGGPLLLDTGSASGAATLSSATDVSGGRLVAADGVAVGAGRDLTLTTVSADADAGLTAGRTLSVTNATTPAGLTLNGTTVNATTLSAGALIVRAGAGGGDLRTVMTTRAAAIRSDAGLAIGQLATGSNAALAAGGSFVADRIEAGTGIVATGAMTTVGAATARGGDVALAATGGDLRLGAASASGAVALTGSGAASVTGAVSAGTAYRIDAASVVLGTAGATARQAGADVALTARTGIVAAQGSTTLVASRSLAISANGAGSGIAFAPETTIDGGGADVALATRGTVALGTVAAGGAIRIDAADAVLTRPVTAQAVTLTNVANAGVTRLGDVPAGNEAEFATSPTRFDLGDAEIALIAAPTVTIASGARDVLVGALALGTRTGATRFAITAGGRVDMLGRFVAFGATAARTIAIGNEASGTTAGTTVIRVAATQAEGGRLLVDGAMLELAADRIGVGLDRDFLDAIGYRTVAGIGVDAVTSAYVARPTSTLYNASALGAQPFADPTLVQAGRLTLRYGRYALIQNTGRGGEQSGVVLGTAGATGPTLRLLTPNSATNTFSLFGTINGIGSQAAALLGPDRIETTTGVSPVASRINGCVIGSGAGCLNTSIAQPALNLFDASRAEIVRTADDLTLPFDPLIGTNNEALYLDIDAVGSADDCKGDTPCPAKP